MIIKKEKVIRFSATHILPAHPGHCHRIHGHNFIGDIEIIGSKVDSKSGFLEGIDFGDISKAVDSLNERLDHKFIIPTENENFITNAGLEDVEIVIKRSEKCGGDIYIKISKEDLVFLPIKHSTCECLAEWLRKEIIKKMSKEGVGVKVQLWENDSSSYKV